MSPMNLNPAVGGLPFQGELAEFAGMGTQKPGIVDHLLGEQPTVEPCSAVADTFAGRVHVEWDATAPVTPFGQLPFFIDYLKQAGLFDAFVADCPLSLTSNNAPKKRDLLGTVLLSVLSGHRRYAHITALRCDPVNPSLLGMRKVCSEDAVRRGLAKIGEAKRLSFKPAWQSAAWKCILPKPRSSIARMVSAKGGTRMSRLTFWGTNSGHGWSEALGTTNC